MKTTTKKSSSPIIRDITGKRLRLTPSRLLQIDHSSNYPWYATRENLAKAFRLDGTDSEYAGQILIHESRSRLEKSLRGSLLVTFRNPSLAYGPLWNLPLWNLGKIGCCLFDFPTFEQIRKYYRIRKTSRRAAAAKAGA